MLSLTAIGTPASGSREREVVKAREVRADAIVDGVDLRQMRLRDFARRDRAGCDVARDLRAAAFDDVGHMLLGDDAGNAKETALALRSLFQDDLAIEARTHRVLPPHVARLHDLRGRRNGIRVEFGQCVHVREQIAELRAEAIDLFVGQCDSREFGDVAYVNLIG
jgi:hypothetical protein